MFGQFAGNEASRWIRAGLFNPGVDVLVGRRRFDVEDQVARATIPLGRSIDGFLPGATTAAFHKSGSWWRAMRRTIRSAHAP